MSTKVLFIVAIVLLLIKPVSAQYSKIIEFSKNNTLMNAKYSQPVFDGTWIYDVCSREENSYGAIYKIKPDGTGYTRIYSFGTSTNGVSPCGSLILSGDTLFGTVNTGGKDDKGCVFAIKTDGTNYTKIVDFTGQTGIAPGANPFGGLVLYHDTIYGTASKGGTNNYGIIYKVKRDGTGFTVLKNLEATGTPRSPESGLIRQGNVLYGQTTSGGTFNYGCIYKITTSGSYSSIYSFNNADVWGYLPMGMPLLKDNVLYGVTSVGSDNSKGALFKINTDGSGLERLASFSETQNFSPNGSLIADASGNLFGTSGNKAGSVFKFDGNTLSNVVLFDQSNGYSPRGQLLLLGDTLLVGTTYGDYGVTPSICAGNMFRVNKNGKNLKSILVFSSFIDGAYPAPNCFFAYGDTVFGVTQHGGKNGAGVIFRINPDGAFKKVYDFDWLHGANPMMRLVMYNGMFYGVTMDGAKNNFGCVYKIKPDGTGYTPVYDFEKYIGPTGMVMSNDTMIIATHFYDYGGPSIGALFSVQADGSNFRKIHQFENENGSLYVPDGLIIKDYKVYGNCLYGGANGLGFQYGGIFEIRSDGTGYSKVIDLTANKGYCPWGTPEISGDTLFAATMQGGSIGKGNLFSVKTDRNGYTLLQDFTGTNGKTPFEGVIIIDNVLYGTTSEGGQYAGILYSVNRDGSNFKVLVNFGDVYKNGKTPKGRLFYLNGALYGTTSLGTPNYQGTIFKYQLVSKTNPTIWWNNQADITYGTLLDETQLNANSNVPGTFSYNPAKGTKLNAGSNQVLSVVFTPTDTKTYNSVSLSTNINVLKANPIITWNNPVDMVAGGLLGTEQLNATADVPGNFTYTPAAGTIMAAGNNQNLRANFVPSDMNNYNSVEKSVSINVLPLTGVQASTNAEVKIYPVPASGYIEVTTDRPFCAIEILSADGILIKKIKVEELTQKTIDISRIPAGYYFLSIRNKTGVTRILKFVKQ